MADGNHIRNVARGVLVDGDRVLLIEVNDGHGRWWILPGGGQHFGETLEECLVRECREELAIEVRVGSCLMVREFLGDRRSAVVGNVKKHHSVELYFLLACDTPPDLKPREKMHERLEWVPATEVQKLKFFPRTLAARLPELLAQGAPRTLYVGDAD
jgi:8-oxo-dGTP pyrophosphatase MutT (NUDIX family)